MRILNLSLDKGILERDSAVQKRLISLAEKVGTITVLVPTGRDAAQAISPHLFVYAVGGSKLIQLLKIGRLSRLLSKNGQKPDVVTVQDIYFLGFIACKLSRALGAPLEVQVHGLEKFSGIRKLVAGFVLQRAHRVRIVSKRLRDFLTSNFQLPTSKLYILPVYTHIEPAEKAYKRKTVPVPFTFLTVGRLVPVKNIGMQIRAIAELSKRMPNIRLRVVGEGPLLEQLKLEARSSKLEDKILFEGYQKDLGRYYQEADAFLLTSDSEGWGRVVLEAASYSLPIIMTDVGLAREVIKNNESGFIIRVGDEHELLLAMKEFVDKPELRERLGKGAFAAFQKLPKSDEQIRRQIEAWQSLTP